MKKYFFITTIIIIIFLYPKTINANNLKIEGSNYVSKDISYKSDYRLFFEFDFKKSNLKIENKSSFNYTINIKINDKNNQYIFLNGDILTIKINNNVIYFSINDNILYKNIEFNKLGFYMSYKNDNVDYIKKNNIMFATSNIITNIERPISINEISQNIITTTNTGIIVDRKPTLLENTNILYTDKSYINFLESKNKKVGKYLLVYESDTYFGMKTYLYLYVIVSDISKPEIINIKNNNTINLSYKDKFNLDKYINDNIKLYDNNILLNNSNIIISKNTILQNKVGKYFVILEYIDQGMNKSDIRLDINIVDDVLPKISGHNTYATNIDNPIKLNDILKSLKGYDEIDKDITKNIKLETKNISFNKSGVYNLNYSLEDSSKNTSYYNVKVHVLENVFPIQNVYDNTLYTSSKSIISIDNIINISKKMGYIKNDIINKNIDIEMSLYKNNYNKKGTYDVYLNYILDNKKHSQKLKIEVLENANIPKKNRNIKTFNISILNLSISIFFFILINMILFSFVIYKRLSSFRRIN